MSRRKAAPRVAGCLLPVLLVSAIGCRRPAEPEAEEDAPAVAAGERAPAEIDLQLVFPGSRGRLYREERTVDMPEDPEALVRAALRELLIGPSGAGLQPPFPATVDVADVFVSPAGIVYVDLSSADDAPPPPSGSRQEMLSVYSVVNSVLLTAPELRAVVVLWNGTQRPSFAGHLDTARPLTLKRDLLAGG